MMSYCELILKDQISFVKIKTSFIKKNECKNDICKVAAILLWPQYIKDKGSLLSDGSM